MSERSDFKVAPAAGSLRMPLLQVRTVPVPVGWFDSPVNPNHVLCLHQGDPVPVSYRMDGHERYSTRLQGRFCVVPAGSSTRWILSAPATSLLLGLAPTVLDETAHTMRLGSRIDDLAPSIHVRDPQVERIGEMMLAEERDGYSSGRLFSDSLALALAARLVALQAGRDAAGERPDRTLPTWRLRHVLDYIEAHLDADLTLTELAAVAGFSVSHFKPLFRQSTGMPAHRYVLERRVERARTLLLAGGRSTGEIALEAGFAHQSHMARCLRRVLGLSPAQLVASRQ